MRRIPRTKGALSGFLIVLLGIWAGLVPFVGPYFHYAMHSNQHWQWFADRFWLEVLPAIVAVVGGLILMGGMTRVTMMFGGLLALAAGLWFIVGPNVSMLWNHGAITVGPPMGRHNITRTLEWIGFFYGVGGLITMFSSALRSEEHTSELQSPYDLVCRLLLEKKKKKTDKVITLENS